ncbi:hypothetical protein BC830DRAFT_1085673 [Chytriomyces sp. MP71]|nr:hypothetical protein BC830DRAFT_1085673 [Chytriomyces sp. MP71]
MIYSSFFSPGLQLTDDGIVNWLEKDPANAQLPVDVSHISVIVLKVTASTQAQKARWRRAFSWSSSRTSGPFLLYREVEPLDALSARDHGQRDWSLFDTSSLRSNTRLIPNGLAKHITRIVYSALSPERCTTSLEHTSRQSPKESASSTFKLAAASLINSSSCCSIVISLSISSLLKISATVTRCDPALHGQESLLDPSPFEHFAQAMVRQIVARRGLYNLDDSRFNLALHQIELGPLRSVTF